MKQQSFWRSHNNHHNHHQEYSSTFNIIPIHRSFHDLSITSRGSDDPGLAKPNMNSHHEHAHDFPSSPNLEITMNDHSRLEIFNNKDHRVASEIHHFIAHEPNNIDIYGNYNDPIGNSNSSNHTNSTQPFMINVSDSFVGIGISYYLYYLFAFLIWLVFFDYVIPGNSLWNVIFSTLAFTLLTIISLIAIHRAKVASSRWSYLLLAACEVLCGFLAYTVFVIRFLMTTNRMDRQKILQNLRTEFKNDTSRLEFIQNEVSRRKWKQSHVLQLHPPSGTFVFYNKIYLQEDYLPRFRKTIFRRDLTHNHDGYPQQLVNDRINNNLEESLLEKDIPIENDQNSSSFQHLVSLEEFSQNHSQQEYVPPQFTGSTNMDSNTNTSIYYTHRESENELVTNSHHLIYYEIEVSKGWTDALIRSLCLQIYLFEMQSKYRTPYAFSTIVDANKGFSLMKLFKKKFSKARTQPNGTSRIDDDHDSTLENGDYVTFDTVLKEHGTTAPHFKSRLSVTSSSTTNEQESNFQFIEEEVTPKEITLLEPREHLMQQANKSSYSIMNDLEEGCCKVTSSVRPPVEYATRSYMIRTLFQVILFKLLVFLIWFYLQSFAYEIWDVTPTEKQAAISIGFQVSRVVIPFILEMASELLLPTRQIESIRYFHNFISQMFFGLFYNYLFVKVETWENFFLLTFINFIFLLVQYPIRATRTAYLITQKVKYWVLYIFGVKKFFPSLFYRVTLQTYEYYLRNICAKFYLYEISSVASTLSFLIFTKILKSSEYNFQMYPILRDRYVKDALYELSITSQSLVLLALEFLFIVIIHVLVFIGTKKHISIVGRKLTVEDGKTRFLFALFMLHFLNDIHYFMQRAPKF
ncbi:hypothetical protein C9374_012945 [Naegleria lovaniensis]|uniref:Transmembrane protein n=1 Tax=Naegleria lovaniensis TaxID=51637 RepID=A0AA88GC99_NAELO|nr:uncharacterized protein C9374_012945 [Naegleria lovaniensis]KAG2373002.1 hypothetical protein C9374_012945 [Naegleria lovaniensis]